MRIAVISDDAHKQELLAQGQDEALHIEWIAEPVIVKDAHAYIDLLFTPDPQRINLLQRLQPALVVVNAVTFTNAELPQGFVRFNGWKSFLKRKIVEAASADHQKENVRALFAAFNKTLEWVPDEPGFITARVVSMIINEAYLAFDEGVSSKEDIDTAMKLGTNYPYGPFEWGKLIGLSRVAELLNKMSKRNERYRPSALLETEANIT